jgi:hypothetical protein
MLEAMGEWGQKYAIPLQEKKNAEMF